MTNKADIIADEDVRRIKERLRQNENVIVHIFTSDPGAIDEIVELALDAAAACSICRAAKSN